MIVAVTSGSPGSVCTGALTTDGRSLRLVDQSGQWLPARDAKPVGSVWEIRGAPAPPASLVPPHVENYRVTEWNDTGKVLAGEELVTAILKARPPNLLLGPRPLLEAFGGSLSVNSRGNLVVDRDAPMPINSVFFWESDQELHITDHSTGPSQHRQTILASTSQGDGTAPYKGLDVDERLGNAIPMRSLLRLSLTTWYPRKARDGEECFLQLSGVLGSVPR